MSASIEFNAEKLIKKLDLIQKAYLPQAVEQALKSFGFESRKTLADEMRSRYQTATNYTLKSPRFKQDGLNSRSISTTIRARTRALLNTCSPPTAATAGAVSRSSPPRLLGFFRASTAPTKSRCRCLAQELAGSSSTRTATSKARRCSR